MSGALISVFANQRQFATVPGAPTIGTATSTGLFTAAVEYTAPASNGGSTITSYTATSSPGGITGTLSQVGSGTITVSGLTANTAYTFTVTATNGIGTSAASSASNSITTPPVIGSALGGGYFAGQISTSGNDIANYNLIVGPIASAASVTTFATGSGSDPTSFIDGPGNSSTMNNASHPAAEFCEGLTIGGFSDWYMPAYNELEVCYYNLKPTTGSNFTGKGTNANAVPSRATNYTAGTPAQTSSAAFKSTGAEDFLTSTDYWCSTQASVNTGWAFAFYSGNTNSNSKTGLGMTVRAIRRVAV